MPLQSEVNIVDDETIERLKSEEEQEKITEAWEEEFYDGLEELGWSCNDTDYILEGPLELLDADDNIVGQGDPS